MGLITELQEEHKELLKLFNEFVVKIDDDGSIERLQNLKRILVLHLEKEDEGLYPILSKSDVGEVKGICAQFNESMRKLSEKVMGIFIEFENKKGKVDDSFKERLIEIGTSLKGRIIIEEYTLFPLYEKFLTVYIW